MTGVRKTALVTGASRGIGAATAKALAADGYHVLVHYGANPDLAEAIAAEIRDGGGSAETVGADLIQPEATAELAAEVSKLCGGQLHALVLNAGIMPGDSSFANCSPETFDEIFMVNLRAPFFLMQHLAPVLAEGASVVMISSVTARRAIGAVAAYGSMKAALESFVRRAAVEFGPRWIRVNGVAPATTASETVTPWTLTEAGREATLSVQALKRINQPEDVADVIAFLCSDKARIVTGAIIPADGGTLL
jgi:NAD(P)-dependent dehydrogenase (short-subunit alcohol dehydrogenase family)